MDLLSRDDSFLKRDYTDIAKVKNYAQTPLKKNEEFTIFKMELISFVNNLLANKKSGKFSLKTKSFRLCVNHTGGGYTTADCLEQGSV
jgi:hypothetical protein